MKKLSQKLHNRVLPFLMAVLMLAASIPLNVFSVGADDSATQIPGPDGYIYDYDTLYVSDGEKEISTLDIFEHEKISIFAEGLFEEATYQWQIQHNEKDDVWINIYDGTDKELPVTLALLGNLLRENNTAQLRCRAYTEDYAYLTMPVTVTVKESSDTSVISITPQTQKDPSFMADGDDDLDHPEFVTVTIEYKLVKYIKISENNYDFTEEIDAFNPYIATLVYNSSLTTSVPNPTVVGFKPYLVDGENLIPCDQVSIELTGIKEDKTYKVLYKPSDDVAYRVQYLFQNIYDDLYSEDKTVPGVDDKGNPITGKPYTGKGTTGLPPQQGVDNITFEGFTALYYQPDTIAADGSTVFEIYFERNYYLMEFDCNGGYGVNTIYVRHGTYVSVPTPVRPGYVFDGWDKKGTDAAADKLPQEMPPYNSSYKAIWVTTSTTYTVVYWAENANDTNYSYWGTVLVGGSKNADGKIIPNGSVMSASLVSGTNHSTAPSSLKDYQHFTYNEELTLYKESQRDDLQDGKVIVEGDGSTVVNVYFSRKVYTLTFTDSKASQCQLNEHTHTDDCYTYLCDAHVHVASCYSCGKIETPHSTACCSLAHSHTSCSIGTCLHKNHDITCYTNNSSVVEATTSHHGFTTVRDNYSNPDEATIYRYCRYDYNNYYYNYFYAGGKWYYLGTSNRNTTTVGGVTWTGTANNSSGAVTKSTSANSPSLCSHVHEDACYSCGKKAHNHEFGCDISNCSDASHHSHDAGCLSCHISHIHTSACPKTLTCNTPAHTHSVDDKKFSNKIIKVLNCKYNAYIGDEFNFVTDLGTKYPKSGDTASWDPKNSSTLDQRLILIDIMPGDDFELQYNPKNQAKRYYNYYVECLEGETPDTTYGGKNYKYYFSFGTLEIDFAKYTEAEDFFAIAGFTKNVAVRNNKTISNNTNLSSGDTVNFYYTRNSYQVKYFNYIDFVKVENTNTDQSVTLKYQQSLKPYEITKEVMEQKHYPSTLEPGAYEFAGWYTTSGCFDGTEVDWETDLLPDNDLTLYAKWTPIKRNVYFFEDLDDLQDFENDKDPNHCWQPAELISYPIVVDHGTLLGTAYNHIPQRTGVESPSAYYFIGWFYFDENGKKKFAPDSMEVDRDLYLFAEWKTSLPTTYNIQYQAWKKDSGGVEELVNAEIAKPLADYSTAGKTVTFEAAGTTRLYDLSGTGGDNYQIHWFPEAASHSLLMDVDSAQNTYTFRYFYKEKINYKVVYKDRVSGKILGESEVKATEKAIVTEKYKPFENYYPEQYYIERAIAYDPTDYTKPGYENFVLEDNVIYFYYIPDTEHAPYHVKHFKETVDGGVYELVKAYQGVADLNTKITEPVSEYTGFVFDYALVYHYTEVSPGNWKRDSDENAEKITNVNAVTGEVRLGGLDIEIYYKRIQVGYTIQYVQYGTTKVLKTIALPGTNTAVYGSQITHTGESGFQIGDIKYTYYLDNSTEADRTMSMTIRENAADNVLIFYYNEKTVWVNYHVVCSVPSLAGNNGVSLSLERAATPSGLAGSNAMKGTGFIFKGWFMDETCKNPVPSEWVTGSTHLTPGELHDPDGDEHVHFYALFEPICGELLIKKSIDGTGATGATFLFRVKGLDTNNKHIDTIVSIQENTNSPETVLLKDVPIGDYSITELTGWSWEFATATSQKEVVVEEGKRAEVNFESTNDPSNWLSDETVDENHFN